MRSGTKFHFNCSCGKFKISIRLFLKHSSIRKNEYLSHVNLAYGLAYQLVLFNLCNRVSGKVGCHMQPTLAFVISLNPNECSIFCSCFYFSLVIIITFVKNVSLNFLSEFPHSPVIQKFPKT